MQFFEFLLCRFKRENHSHSTVAGLFEVLNARENRKVTIIAAQIPRSDWYDLFRNDTYADACMDRITKSNFLIELEGPSLR